MTTPDPYGAVPSIRQLAWHDRPYYGFLHFTVNTFTDTEWGYGDEEPPVFNPTAFDADQIVETAKNGGMAGLILTAKHHDGFCLWPSRYTDHTVRNSPWRAGGGDVVREVSDACLRHGIGFGVYLSPWDRNHAEYGRRAYLEYYRNQLRELLSEYGPMFEVWFDGANGGDGYYGGARERREIDRRTYYEWDTTWQIVRDLQPDACIFSDAGPDVRWVGNENGVAGEPCFPTVDRRSIVPGEADNAYLNVGRRGGPDWVPAECDVSIRPGWFYHAAEDERVRSPENLVELYFNSVGRGASLLLNLPPDPRGVIHENDIRSLGGFRRRLDQIFGTDLARTASTTVRPAGGSGADREFSAACVIDGDPQTYWTTADNVHAAELVLHFPTPVTLNVVRLREYVPLGLRVETFALDVQENDRWVEYARGDAIGARRVVRVPTRTTRAIRVRVDGSVRPALSEIAVFFDPACHA